MRCPRDLSTGVNETAVRSPFVNVTSFLVAATDRNVRHRWRHGCPTRRRTPRTTTSTSATNTVNAASTRADSDVADAADAVVRNGASLACYPRIPRRVAQVHWSPIMRAAEVALMQAWHQAFNETNKSGIAFEYEFFDRPAAINFTATWCPQATDAIPFHEQRQEIRQMDTFRYCYLWTHGGIVVDTDIELLAPLDEVLLPSDELVLVEYDAAPTLFSGFIAAAAGNRLIYSALMMPYVVGDERLRVAFGERPSQMGGNCAAGRLLPDWKVRMLNYVHDPNCVLGVIEDVVTGGYDSVPARRSLMHRGYPGRDRPGKDRWVAREYVGDGGVVAWQPQWVRWEIDEKQFKPLEDGTWSPTLCFPQRPSETRGTLVGAYEPAAETLVAPSRREGSWPPLVDLTTLLPVSIVLPIVDHVASEADPAELAEGGAPEGADVPFQWVLTWCTLAKKIFAFDSVATPCERNSVVAQYRDAKCEAAFSEAVTVQLIAATDADGERAPRDDGAPGDTAPRVVIAGVSIRARGEPPRDGLRNESHRTADNATTTTSQGTRTATTSTMTSSALLSGSRSARSSHTPTSQETSRPWIDVFMRCDAAMLPGTVAVDGAAVVRTVTIRNATAVARAATLASDGRSAPTERGGGDTMLTSPPSDGRDLNHVVTYRLRLKSRCACAGGCGMAAWFSRRRRMERSALSQTVERHLPRGSGMAPHPAEVRHHLSATAPVADDGRPLLSAVNRTAFELWLKQHLGLAEPLVPPDHLRRCLRRVPRHHRECLQHGSWCVAPTATGARRIGPKPLLPPTCEVNRRDLWLSLSDVDGGWRYRVDDDAATAQTTCSLVPKPGLVNASLERCLAAVADTPGANVAALCEPPRRVPLGRRNSAATTVSSPPNSSLSSIFSYPNAPTTSDEMVLGCVAIICSPSAPISRFRASEISQSVREVVHHTRRLRSCGALWIRNPYSTHRRTLEGGHRNWERR